MIVQAEKSYPGDGLVLFRWDNIVPGDTANHVDWAQFADRSVQAFGTGTVTVQGSNDGEHWATLHDLFGNPAVISGNGLIQITEICLFIRPSVTLTGANQTVLLLGRNK